MEHERRARAERIHVTVPGVMRGFDAMYVRCIEEVAFLLPLGDGSIPYRTSCAGRSLYDDRSVVAVLEQDFEEHGAPLVLRLDRARQHGTKRVLDLLAAHHVLVLQGPPHRPQYYGQLERQNREHRAWLDRLPHAPLNAQALARHAVDMRAALNGSWRRSTLGWRTAAELWSSRPRITIDRQALREEVGERAERIRRGPGEPTDLAGRLAIEQILEAKGLLTRELGGWC
jgi:hypothetical protein